MKFETKWKLIVYEKGFCYYNCCFGELCARKGANWLKKNLIEPEQDIKLTLAFTICGSAAKKGIYYTPVLLLKNRRF